jgi:hypothetical protein
MRGEARQRLRDGQRLVRAAERRKWVAGNTGISSIAASALEQRIVILVGRELKSMSTSLFSSPLAASATAARDGAAAWPRPAPWTLGVDADDDDVAIDLVAQQRRASR